MSLLQLWLFVVIPALILGLALFIGRSPWRSALGYLVLLVGFLVSAFFHAASAAIIGGVIALVYAAGRGGAAEHTYDPIGDKGHRAADYAERARGQVGPPPEPPTGGSEERQPAARS